MEWCYVWRPGLTSKGVARFVSISWASCCHIQHHIGHVKYCPFLITGMLANYSVGGVFNKFKTEFPVTWRTMYFHRIWLCTADGKYGTHCSSQPFEASLLGWCKAFQEGFIDLSCLLIRLSTTLIYYKWKRDKMSAAMARHSRKAFSIIGCHK